MSSPDSSQSNHNNDPQFDPNIIKIKKKSVGFISLTGSDDGVIDIKRLG